MLWAPIAPKAVPEDGLGTGWRLTRPGLCRWVNNRNERICHDRAW